jgi:hypothetical protein
MTDSTTPAVPAFPAQIEDAPITAGTLSAEKLPEQAVTTSTAPAQPSDHQAPAAERADAALADDDLIADVQGLKPVHKLRLRQRNALIALMFKMTTFKEDYPDVEKADKAEEEARKAAEAAGVDFEPERNPEIDGQRRELQLKMLEFGAEVDEYFEANVADDPEAYVGWAEGKEHNAIFSLLSHYAGFSKN